MTEKLSRKELKAPDALQKAGLEARHWLEGRHKAVAAIMVILLLAGAGVALANYVSDRTEERASKALGAVLRDIDRPVAGEENPNPPAGDGKPPFKSQKERDEAAVKALGDFQSKFHGTKAALTGELRYGQSACNLGNYDQALSAFSDFAKSAPAEEPLRILALEGVGYAYEGKNQLEQALAAFEEMARNNKSGYMNGMGLYHRGRILMLQGKKEEAAKAFAEIPTAAPNTPAAKMATERMALLTSQGVSVPAPTIAPASVDGG